jgi:hypothetical protein
LQVTPKDDCGNGFKDGIALGIKAFQRLNDGSAPFLAYALQ